MSSELIVPAIVLDDAGDNSQTVTDNDKAEVAVALDGRTLYLDGKWNTICLPFNQSVSEFKGLEARTITAANIEGTMLHLTFGNPVDELVAGTPYIIKFAKEDDYVADGTHDYLNPVFYGVTINATAKHDYDNGATGNLRVRFLGTYAKQSFDAEDKSILFMGSDNTLYYPQNGASIGAQRAYFKIGDDNSSAPTLLSFNIYFGDSETTGIITISKESGSQGDDDGWYSLDGRKLSGKSTKKGLYIVNGRKVVVK